MSPSSLPAPSADDAPAPLARLVRLWPYLGISLLWLGVALIFAGQQSFTSGQPFLQVARGTVLEWLCWILLAPLLFAVALRFPPHRGRLVLASAINLLAALLAIAAAEFLFMTVSKPAPPRTAETAANPAAPREGPPREVRRFPPREDSDFGPGWPPPPGDEFGDFPPPGRRRPAAPGEGPPARPEAPAGPADNRPGAGTPIRHLVHFHLPIALFVVMAAQAHAALLGLRERERRSAALAASLAQAKLSALQAQLQPHFLFNALNALATIVHRDANQADEMINNLAELLRRSLAAGKRPETTLGEELDHLACYLSIERVRFGDRLQVDWRIDDEVRSALVPVLALQPILENAIKHGVERRRETVGRILIAASAEAGRLRITVTDNGPGPELGSSATPAPVRPGHGIGLANTRARLHALHGNDATVSLDPATGGGCRVTVTLPLRLQPRTDPASPIA